VLDSGDPVGEQGWAVDVSGNLAIVGAPYYQGGSAFIFDLTTGNLLHRLTASDPSPSALFGFSVAIDDGLAVVASGQKNAAYVFDSTTGQQLHKLMPTTGSSDFVRSVDVSNGVAVLGTPTIEAAFLYNALSGSKISRINGPTTFGKDEFASVVAIDGNTTAILSPGFGGRGDVYVVDSQSGALRWKYGQSTTGEDFYVADVVIDGGRVVVGGGPGFYAMPTAYALERSTGAFMREIDIRSPNGAGGYRAQLDVSGDLLVVGTWTANSLAGAVHSFDLSTGGFLGEILNPNPMGEDEFGYSLSLEKGRLVVGAPGIDTAQGNQGLTYSFIVPEPTAAGLSAIATLLCMCRARNIREEKVPSEIR
jgi:outer membrane protein assembly factor BamB